MTSANQAYDLLIVVDATSSMKAFLASLRQSLQDIIRLSALASCFERIGVLAYRDVCPRIQKLTEFSGKYIGDGDHSSPSESSISYQSLSSFVENLETESGSDWNEAMKSGLAHAHQVMRPGAKTVVLLYADAPPHMRYYGGRNFPVEQEILIIGTRYGKDSHLFADWTVAAKTLAQGSKRAQVFAIIDTTHRTIPMQSAVTYLTTITGGSCLEIQRSPSAEEISRLTVELLMAWMGVGIDTAKLDTQILANLLSYKDISGIKLPSCEFAKAATRYLVISKGTRFLRKVNENLNVVPVSLVDIHHMIPRRENPLMDFSHRYTTEPEYRSLVVKQLGEIMDSDVAAISLNPVFATLWRTVCNDRLSVERNGLTGKFGASVTKIRDAEKRSRMESWLEASYDYSTDINDALTSVPVESLFPCVFLDTSLHFGGISDFTRKDLLEIGRSCDYKILRRLGKVLTQLTYADSEDDIPNYTSKGSETKTPLIPLALAQPEDEGKLWKILLHTVIPGTMLSPRAAALLAALSVRMGIKPLEEAAFTELGAAKGTWNTLDIPETWNTNCLSLLLEVDQRHRHLRAEKGLETPNDLEILLDEDRRLFQVLVEYKILEMNLETTLPAKTAWRPE